MFDKLITVTPENLNEITQKVKEFVGTERFKQTHDWMIDPFDERKRYEDLTFKYPQNTYSSETVVLKTKDGISIADQVESECYAFCDEDECDECEDVLELALIGDQIEFFDNAINVISHSYDPTPDKNIVVWRLFR